MPARERSVSRGHTFSSTLSRPGEVEAFADELLEECLTQLQTEDIKYYCTVGVTVKFRSFDVKTHSKRIGLRRNTDGHAARTALHFLLQPYSSRFDDIRFVGVRVAVDVHRKNANIVATDEVDVETDVYG